MAEEKDPERLPAGPPTAVPTPFGTDITLPPGGSATINFQVGDQDLLLSGISATAQGPAVLRLRISNTPDPGALTVQLPGGTFEEYLDRELPVHLAARVEEDPEAWGEKNHALLQAAAGGDDEAFFDLLARDPRQLASELTLRRVLTWRTEIDQYNQFLRFKASRFLASEEVTAEARRRMEQARQNLARLGGSQLQLSDQRGKRLLPPAGLVRGVYYGLLCLLAGLRGISKECIKAGSRPQQIDRRLSAVVAALVGLRGESPLLPYVAIAARLVRDPEVLAQADLSGATLTDLVSLQGMMPSDTARAIAAASFDVSTDTIERLCARPAAIPLPSSSRDEFCFFVGPPALDLLELPEVKDLVAKLTR